MYNQSRQAGILKPFLPYAEKLLKEVRKDIQENRLVYFDTSLERYKYSLAAILSEPRAEKILDVGCAQGHLGMALWKLGKKVHGIDLNEEWFDTYPSRDWVERLNILVHNIPRLA